MAQPLRSQPSRALVVAAMALAGALVGAPASRAASTYAIDQRYGTLGFEIVEAGVFTSKGLFTRFAGTLVLDFEHPAQSLIDVFADAGSANIPGPGAIEMLRSADYFDVEHHPRVHFVSSAITPLGANRFHIEGAIEIRGITKPQSFEATLAERHRQPPSSGNVADFRVTGGLSRSQFGMVADQNFISDTVRLDIKLELTVSPS